MSLTIDVIQDQPHCVFEVSGMYDLGEAVDRFEVVLAACKASGGRKVLIDYRKVVGDVAAVEKIIYTFGVAEQYEKYRRSGGRPLRVAYLAPAEQRGDYEPFRDVARVLRLPFILCVDRNEALSWLEKDDG